MRHGLRSYAELQKTVEVAFATARDIHRLDDAQSFEYAYEELLPYLSSRNAAERLLAYTALMLAAKERAVSFAQEDPSGSDIREELQSIIKCKDSLITQSSLGSEADIVRRDLAEVCAAYLT